MCEMDVWFLSRKQCSVILPRASLNVVKEFFLNDAWKEIIVPMEWVSKQEHYNSMQQEIL